MAWKATKQNLKTLNKGVIRMHLYFALSGNIAKTGRLGDLYQWSSSRISSGKAKIIKIVKARPGEVKARIVLEVTAEGVTQTPGGRVVNLYTIKKALRHDI
ncbi:MAG: hypothetical protein R3D66_04690 [Alphaproteobacteria bacterium]